MKKVFLSLFFFFSFSTVLAAERIALVYRGPGACLQCWKSAAQVAKLSGFKVDFVNEQQPTERVFERAVLWVQPGGKSKIAAEAMGPGYLARIRRFIANGGGYVGFCAGTFLSTAKIGTSEIDGLGIVPGTTRLWDQEDGPGRLVPLAWKNEVKQVYYHGGPYIDVDTQESFGIRVYSRYEDGRINAISAPFGYGRVAITGSHPEASRLWKFQHFIRDPDGSDQQLVTGMMKWATGQSEEW
jgi:glutamine amidotransferase-like uncharacterized protein